MSAPLFVTACSLTKEAGGVFEYDGGAAILASLEQHQAEVLVERRNAVRKLVKGGGDADWQGIRLADHPHNLTLAQGDDFGGTRRVDYMPAIDRYKGRFFLALDAESRQRCKAERRTLVLSGLYGMLLAGEPIQIYSCPLTPDVAEIWQEDSLLTAMLCGYVQRNGIACVVDLTAMEAYRRLIDWQTVAKHAGVMHCFDAAAAGEYALTSFGGVFRQLLSMDAEGLYALEREGGPIGTCSLHANREPPSGYPREVWQPYQADEVLRGALPGRSASRFGSDANAAPWGFDMGSRFFGDVRRRGKRDFGSIVGAIVEICQAPVSRSNPRVRPLEGHGGRLWRYRVGEDWRLVYEPDGARRVVRLLRFGPRGDIYKSLAP